MKVRIYFYCIVLQLKRVFLLLFSQRTRQTTYIPSRTMTTTSKVQLVHTPSVHEEHVLEFYSINQIPFYHIKLRSITWHFLINNLNFITYSNRIIQPQIFHSELNATASEFLTISDFEGTANS